MSNITQAIQLKQDLDALRPLNVEQEAKIMQKFRLDWDYHSNHIEGNSLSYGETKALILFGITAQGKPLKDHFEITGHDEAIKWVTDIVQGNYPFTETFIRELHTLLLKESYEVDAVTPDGLPTKKRISVGAYKTSPNHVKTKTGEIFRFAEPEETPALMHDLMNWYQEKTAEEDFDPILVAAEYHYKFIRIHPFDDGNGRTVRILMNFILMKNGYPPVIIKTEDKENYYSVLRQADAGIITPFIEYIAENLCRSLEIMIKGAKGESIEEPNDLDKEIALLEKKVRSKGRKVTVSKNRVTVEKVLNKLVKNFLPEFINKCTKFNRFYISSKLFVIVNDVGISYNENSFSKNRIYEVIHQGIQQDLNNKKDIQSAAFRFRNSGFNNSGFESFDFESSIIIKFELVEYIVFDSQSQVSISKAYDEELSTEEINKLINAEIFRHKNFIENKLEENK